MFSKNELEHILNAARKKGGDFIELYVESSSVSRIKLEDTRLQEVVSGEEGGMGLRILSGMESMYLSAIQSEELKGLIKNLAQREVKLPEIRLGSPVKKEMMVKIHPSQISIEDKARIVKEADQFARKTAGEVRQVEVVYSDVEKDIVILNSSGLWMTGKRLYIQLFIRVVAEKEGLIQTGTERVGGTTGFEFFDKVDVGLVARTASERAVRMLDARKAPSGKRTVILSSEAGGTMIHEAIGHSLEADSIRKGTSPQYVGMLGRKVASELITVVDDPTLFGNQGSYPFDDEGTIAQRTVLVEKGILRNYLYDTYTSRLEKRDSTGNGRRENYQFNPLPRMSNTFILPGAENPEEIIKSVRKGLLVRRMGGGEVNTTSGDFVFDVEEGYDIEDGEIKAPIRGAVLMGNGPAILRSINRVGRDLRFIPGTCGKDGQWVPVSDGQPTLRIPEILIGGTE